MKGKLQNFPLVLEIEESLYFLTVESYGIVCETSGWRQL